MKIRKKFLKEKEKLSNEEGFKKYYESNHKNGYGVTDSRYILKGRNLYSETDAYYETSEGRFEGRIIKKIKTLTDEEFRSFAGNLGKYIEENYDQTDNAGD